jgi:hypothetical protein
LSAPTNFYPYLEDLKAIVYPMVCCTIEVKKDPKHAEWLFMKIRSHQIANGRYDQWVEVVDESGDLVALAKHVCTAVEIRRRKKEKMTGTISEGRHIKL